MKKIIILIFIFLFTIVAVLSYIPLDIDGVSVNMEETETNDNNTFLFNKILTDSEIDKLLDTTITFRSIDYDISEKILIELKAELDRGYKNYIEYYYAFDETIDLTSVSIDNPLKIEFLGKPLNIIEVTQDSITKFIGNQYPFNSGDSAIVEGKTVKLSRVGSAGAIVVDVDGVSETIKARETEIVNNIEIYNGRTFYDSNNQAASSAVLLAGKFETYKNGDSYNSEWVWNIGNLNEKSSTVISEERVKGPYIGIRNVVKWNELDKGDCVELPNDYPEICLPSISDYVVKEETKDEETCIASNEICDGIDNDCDDEIDEDLTRKCGETDIGECSFGIETCSNGKWNNCNAIFPKEKTCDGKDNDCDSLIDVCCDGCLYNDKCLSKEERIENKYCSLGLSLESQKDENELCSYDYECITNNCKGGICKKKTIVKVILNWFKSLFGGF